MIFRLSFFVVVSLLLHIPATAQVNSLIPIHNNQDFDTVYTRQRPLGGYMKKANFDTAWYFQQARLLVEYARERNDINRWLKAKYLFVLYHNNVTNDREIIARGNELMAYPEFFDLPLSVHVLDAVKQAYERNELFREELEIIPVLHRQGNRWEPEIYSLRNVDADLAIVYYRLSNFEEAIAKFKTRIDFHRKKSNYYELSGIHNNCGLAFLQLELADSAYRHFQLAAHYLDELILTKTKTKTRRSYLIHFRKVIRVNILQNSTAAVPESVLTQAIKDQLRSAILEGENHIVVGSYNDLAKIAHEQGKYSQSLAYCDSALQVMKTYSNVKLYHSTLSQQILSHIRMGNVRNAEHILKVQKAFSDSLQIARTQNEHNIALVRFETNQRIQDLREARQEAESERKISRTRRFGLIATGILLAITLLLLQRVYISRKKARKQVITINTMLNEKNMLFKEVHHRIKNNLQMVSGLLDLHALKIDRDEVDILVTDTKRHIASMGLVHQMLYQDDRYGVVDAHSYFNTLVSNTLAGLGKHSLRPNVEIDKVELPIDKIIPIGLALCEMMVNTYKYAYPTKEGAIDISLQILNNDCTFSYADYGVGVNETDLNNEDSGSIGSTLIDLLTEEIGGTLEKIHSGGLKYVIKYNVNDEG